MAERGELNLMGIGFPLPAGEPELDGMARCFVEEFARMGWTGEQILALFRDPFYRGPHAVWQRRGEPYVRALLAHTGLEVGPLPRTWGAGTLPDRTGGPRSPEEG